MDYARSGWTAQLPVTYREVVYEFPDPSAMSPGELNAAMDRTRHVKYRAILDQAWEASTAHPPLAWDDRVRVAVLVRRHIHQLWKEELQDR